jgi:phage FluMu gp28-like protein
MREELDAIPKESAGQSIPGVWIEDAMSERRPVLRIVLDSDFAKRSDWERREWANRWIAAELAPLLSLLDRRRQHVFGQDFARWRDFSYIAPAEIATDLRRRVPFTIEMNKVPTRQQEQILWAMIDGLPRFSGGAMDATGSGAILAEYTADKYGLDMIQQVLLSRAWYSEWGPKFVQAFEDGSWDLPKDADLENDLRLVEDVDGIPRVPDVRVQDVQDPELFRHGDGASALMLTWFASTNKKEEVFAYHPVTQVIGPDDDDPRDIRITGGFRRGML